MQRKLGKEEMQAMAERLSRVETKERKEQKAHPMQLKYDYDAKSRKYTEKYIRIKKVSSLTQPSLPPASCTCILQRPFYQGCIAVQHALQLSKSRHIRGTPTSEKQEMNTRAGHRGGADRIFEGAC